MASIVTHDGKGKSFLSCLTGQRNDNRSNDQQQQQITNVPTSFENTQDGHRYEMKETQTFLASEMNKLSVQERSTVLDDVHCVGEGLVETPEMVQQSLEAFEVAIQQTNNKNPIYELALQQNPSYVEDPSFRLPFLRANMHNVDRSVSQMMNFLQYKEQYFGTERLTRDITLDDLSEEERGLMMSGGFYHIQDGRDRSGRVIIYNFNHMLGRFPAETLIRVAYYVWVHMLIPIPEVQMKGVSVIYYDMANPSMDPFPSPSLNFCMTVMKFAASLPIRQSSMNVCLKNGMTGNLELNDTILGFTLKKFSQHDRVRTSLLFGSDLELQYQLRSRGIPVDDTFPVDADGNFCQEDILNKWLYKHIREDERMIMESEPSADYLEPLVLQAEDPANVQGELRLQPFHGFDSDDHYNQVVVEEPPAVMAVDHQNQVIVEEPPAEDDGSAQNLLLQHQQLHLHHQQHQVVQPTNRDVLLGKGMRIQLHPGNVHFRAFLGEHSDEYDCARRKEKPQFCTNMATILQSQGIRFLQQQSPEVWIVCDLQEASKKVGDFFRTIRKKKSTNRRQLR